MTHRTSTRSTNILQTSHTNATKAENLEHDFIKESSKTKELGWSDEKSNPKCWLEKARDSESYEDLLEGKSMKARVSRPRWLYRGLIV